MILGEGSSQTWKSKLSSSGLVLAWVVTSPGKAGPEVRVPSLSIRAVPALRGSDSQGWNKYHEGKSGDGG